MFGIKFGLFSRAIWWFEWPELLQPEEKEEETQESIWQWHRRGIKGQPLSNNKRFFCLYFCSQCFSDYLTLLVSAHHLIIKFHFNYRNWKSKENRQRYWRMTVWTSLPKRKSLRKWTLMKESCWRRTTVRINRLIFKVTKLKEDTCNNLFV